MGIFGNISQLFRKLGQPQGGNGVQQDPNGVWQVDQNSMQPPPPPQQQEQQQGQGQPQSSALEYIQAGPNGFQFKPDFETRMEPLPDMQLPPMQQNRGIMGGGLFRQFGGYRQYGGPVRRDRAYVVGENGPEIFMPEDDGAVQPNPVGPWMQTLGGYGLDQPAAPPAAPAPLAQPVAAPPPTMRRQMGPESMDDVIANDAAQPGYAPQFPTVPGGGTGSETPSTSRPRVVDAAVGPPPAMGGSKGLLRNGSIGGRQSDAIYRDVQGIDSRIAQTQKGQDAVDPVTGEKTCEHSFWKRFGKGFINAAKNADPAGGLGGMLLEGIGGAVNSGASPQAHQVSQLRGDKSKLLRTLGQQQGYEMADAKIDAQESVADENYAQIRQGQVAQSLAISKAESDRRRQIIEDARADREEKRRDRTEEREERKSQAQYDAGGNKEVVDIKQRNAEKRTKHQETHTKEKNEQAKLRISGQEKMNAAAELEKQAAAANLFDRGDLYKEAAKLRTEGRDLMQQGNEYKFTPEPTYEDEKSVKTPNLATGSVTESAFRAKLDARKITDEKQIQALIDQAKKDGVIR